MNIQFKVDVAPPFIRGRDHVKQSEIDDLIRMGAIVETHCTLADYDGYVHIEIPEHLVTEMLKKFTRLKFILVQ